MDRRGDRAAVAIVKTLSMAALAAASVAALSGCAAPDTAPPPAIPARLVVPATQELSLKTKAVGVQIYECAADRDDATRFEWVLWDKVILHVAGVDEAGLSPLAGPASAAASFPVRVFPALMIQKKLNAAERERLAAEIKRTAVAWSVGFADVSEIDTINIYWASQLAVKRALAGLLVRPGHVLVDGRRIQDMKIAQQPIIKGDAKSVTIAAASILAKTARDALI